MYINKDAYFAIKEYLTERGVVLVAVSKTKPIEAIQELYDMGQRDFGENYVQELVEKYTLLPKDIRWHFIGHLQSNKVKYIAPFVFLIHGVDSEKLLKEIQKEGIKNNRIISCLLQLYIAKEETKFGMDSNEIANTLEQAKTFFGNVSIKGLMGMASFTTSEEKIREEFVTLNNVFQKNKFRYPYLTIMSGGMSADYKLAIACGSNMVRIGSLLFGAR